MPPLISEVTAYVDLARLIFSHITLMRKDTVTFDHRSLISFSLTLYRAPENIMLQLCLIPAKISGIHKGFNKSTAQQPQQ